MTTPLSSRSYTNYGKKLQNHNGEVMKDTAKGRFRERTHLILLREAWKAAWRRQHLTWIY